MAEKTTILTLEQRKEQMETVLNEIDTALKEGAINRDELHEKGAILLDLIKSMPKGAIEDRLHKMVRTCITNVLTLSEEDYSDVVKTFKAIGEALEEPSAGEAAPTETQVYEIAKLEHLRAMNQASMEAMIASMETRLKDMPADHPEKKGVETELGQTKQIYQDRFGPEQTRELTVILRRRGDIQARMIADELLNAVFHQTGDDRLQTLNKIGKGQEDIGGAFEIKTEEELRSLVEQEFKDSFETENIPENVLDWDEVLGWLVIKLKDMDQLETFSNALNVTFSVMGPLSKKPDEKVAGIEEYLKDPGKLIPDVKKMTEKELKKVIEQFETALNSLPEDHVSKEAGKMALDHAKSAYEARFEAPKPTPPPPDAGPVPPPPPPPPDVDVVPPTPPEAEAQPPTPPEATFYDELTNIIGTPPDNEKLLKLFYQTVTDYVKTRPEAQKLFLGAMEILAKKAGTEDLQNTLAKSLDYFKKLSPEQLKKEQFMVRLFERLEPHTNAIREALEDKEKQQKAEDKKNVLLRLSMGELEREITKIYAVLKKDPKSIENETYRHFLKKVQQECQKFLDNIDEEQLENLDLEAEEKEVQKIKQAFEKPKKFIDKLEAKIGPIEPEKEPEEPEGPPPAVVAAAAPPPETAAVISKPPPPAPEVTTGPKAGEAKKKESKEKGGEKAPEAAKVEATVKKFLTNEQIYSKDDPTCRAIEALVMENKLDLKQLESFLRNPRKELKDSIDQEAIKNEQKSGETYEQLKKRLEDEIEDIKEDLRQIAGHRPTPEEEDKRDKLQDRRKKLRGILNDLGILIQIEKDFAEYSSPRHILGLVAYFIERHKHNKKEEDIKIEHIEGIVTRAVTKQKNAMKEKWGAMNVIGFCFRPGLKRTLMALKEDEELSQLSEKPEVILAKLAKAKTQTDVREWLMDLSGKSREKFSEHVHKTVPRLIAYLEIAVREGKSSSVTRTRPFEDLIRLLRGVQHNEIRNEVQRKESNLRKRMILYLEEINKINRYTDGISIEILKKNAFRSKGAKMVAVGGLAAAGATALLTPPGWMVLAGLGAASIPAYIASYIKRTPVFDKDRPIIRKWATRSLAASSVGLAGLGMGALAAPVIGAAALPIGAALGLGAIIGGKKGIEAIKEKGPEWYKAGKEQAKKGAWAATKWGVKQGWRGGVWVTKTGLKTAGFILKYGGPWGPFVAFYKAKKYVKERKK